MKKVNKECMAGWISTRVPELMEMEDDVLIGMIINMLDVEVRIPFTPAASGGCHTSTHDAVRMVDTAALPCVHVHGVGADAGPIQDATGSDRLPEQARVHLHERAVVAAVERTEEPTRVPTGAPGSRTREDHQGARG